MIEIINFVLASTTLSFQTPAPTTLYIVMFWITHENDRPYWQKKGVFLVPFSLGLIFFEGGVFLVASVLVYYWANDRIDQLTPRKKRYHTVHQGLYERFGKQVRN